MPFGLRNAGQTFQRYIHQVLSGLDYCVAYFDDLIIASKDENEHTRHLHEVFTRLSDHGLKLNPSKCVLGQTTVSFLGCLITPSGVSPLPEKTKVIADFPKPETIAQLRRFLAMLNFYRRFLKNAAATQAPLHEFLKDSKKNDKRPVPWTEEASAMFEKCKADLAQAAALSFHAPGQHLSLMVDASNTAIGAVLNVLGDKGSHPLAFFSRKLSPTEQRYSTYDRELLAIYSAIKYFRHILEGQKFTIFTDHRPLTFAFTKISDSSSPRQLRQLDYIAQFSADIRHVSGTENVVADTLSRIQEIDVKAPVDFTAIAVDQTTDEELKSLLSDPNCSLKLQPLKLTPELQIFCDTSDKRIRPFVTPKFRRQIFDSLHNLSHPGVRATKKLILARFVWPSISKDITLWSRTCIHCQRSKVSRHTKSPLQAFLTTAQRFDHVHVDLVGPLPPSNGSSYLLTCVDRFTRWPEAIPWLTFLLKPSPVLFIEHWIARFGVPSIITTDQGRQFQSALFSSLTSLLGVKHIRTTPYHPASNGLVERFHRSLKQSLKCHNNARWTEALPLVLLGLRSAFKTDLQCTVAELVYGSPVRLPAEFLDPTAITGVEPAEFLSRLRDNMQKLSPKPTSLHDKSTSFVHPALETCTHVFLRRDGVRKPLQAPFDGPYQVLERTAKHFTISIQNRTSTVSVDRLKPAFLLDDESPSTTGTSTNAEPPSSGVPAHLVPPSPEVPSADPDPLESPSNASAPTVTRSGRQVRFNPRYL